MNNRTKSRANIKDKSASTLRQSMNQRRHDLSSKIRKSRRTHQIQLKRRLDSSAPPSIMSSSTSTLTKNKKSLKEAIEFFLTHPNEPLALTELQSSFSSHVSSASSPSNETNLSSDYFANELLNNHREQANQLVTLLHTIFISSSSLAPTAASSTTVTGTDTNNYYSKLEILRILTNFAATTNTAGGDDDMSYYGKATQSWCEFMIQHPCNILNTILLPSLQLISSITSTSSSPTESLEIKEKLKMIGQACWVTGNLAGDSQKIRTIITTQSNTIHELIQVYKQTSYILLKSLSASSSMSMQLYSQDSDTMKEIVESVRNSIWALSNIARGDTSALLFVNSSLSSLDFIPILEQDTNLDISSSSSWNNPIVTNGTVSWIDIQIEIYWLLVYLTAKEDVACEMLLHSLPSLSSSSTSSPSPSLIDILAFHLDQATTMILESCHDTKHKKTVTRDDNIVVRMIIPLIRIVGNLACTASGKFIPTLLMTNIQSQEQQYQQYQQQTNHQQEQQQNIVHVFAKWMYVTNPTRDIITIATEVTWSCGALLCDAGYENHPSTTIACPTLLPSFCYVLTKSNNATLEWKREILSALWNTFSAPPKTYDDNDGGGTTTFTTGVSSFGMDETIGVRDKLLLDMYREEGMIKATLDMIEVSDVDAIRLALCIIDAIHRRLLHRYDTDGNVKRTLIENSCLDILEGVCDSASANAQYGSGREWQSSTDDNGKGINNRMDIEACAEMAANLIDDFYDEATNDEDDICFSTSSGTGRIAFGVDSGSLPVFDFSGTSTSNNFGSSNNNASTQVAVQESSFQGTGQGRGRGKVMPSWMTQQQR